MHSSHRGSPAHGSQSSVVAQNKTSTMLALAEPIWWVAQPQGRPLQIGTTHVEVAGQEIMQASRVLIIRQVRERAKCPLEMLLIKEANKKWISKRITGI